MQVTSQPQTLLGGGGQIFMALGPPPSQANEHVGSNFGRPDGVNGQIGFLVFLHWCYRIELDIYKILFCNIFVA